MTQFTASEVRELEKHMESVGWRPDSNGDPDCCDVGAARSADMLEAREREDSRSLNLNAIVSATRGALAAHSAQAQPPAARVTDAMAKESGNG